MEIDDFKLVELVRKYNVIYDKNHGQHKNKLARFEAFKQIAITLETPADICESRWCLLRNRFCLELRHLRNPIDNSPPRRPWPLFESMKFLSKFIYPRKTRSMLIGYRPAYNCHTEMKTEGDDFEMDFKEPPEEIETTPSLSISDDTDDFKDPNNQEMPHFPVATSMEEEDEDMLFGKMIAMYLRKIKDVDKKIQVKIEMMGLLKKEHLDSA